MTAEALIERALARLADGAAHANRFLGPGLLVALAGWDGGPATEARVAAVESYCAELVAQHHTVTLIPIGHGGLLGALLVA